MSLKKYIHHARIPFAFQFINKYVAQNPTFTILDIGAGNHSATRLKKIFPNCEYHGVDLDKNYNNNQEDFNLMTNFYELDLTQLKFDDIPNQYFDVILMAHVIEHLHNGTAVVQHLIPKLKSGGYFYIEFPSTRSLHLPSWYGTLNFFDDPTHCRLYTLPEILNLFMQQNCQIIKSGTRRHKLNLLLTPIKMLYTKIKHGKILASTLWDLTGFAVYTFAQKK